MTKKKSSNVLEKVLLFTFGCLSGILFFVITNKQITHGGEDPPNNTPTEGSNTQTSDDPLKNAIQDLNKAITKNITTKLNTVLESTKALNEKTEGVSFQDITDRLDKLTTDKNEKAVTQQEFNEKIATLATQQEFDQAIKTTKNDLKTQIENGNVDVVNKITKAIQGEGTG